MTNPERKPECLLGNGVCPPECPLHDQAIKISQKLDSEITPSQRRLNVFFADALSPQVGLVDVAIAIQSCLLETKNNQPDQEA